MENKSEYLKALLAFQAECPQIHKSQDAGGKESQFHYRYAPMDDIAKIVQPLLTKHGFAYRFEKRPINGALSSDMEYIVCIAYHVPSGQSMESCVVADYKTQFEFLTKFADTQARAKGYYKLVEIHKERAKMQTYSKRYAFCDCFGIVTTDDDVETPPEEINWQPAPPPVEEMARQTTEPSLPPSQVITGAQHKRLEARITECGLDRDRVKVYCKKQFGIDHLTDIPRTHYEELDRKLDEWRHLPISQKQQDMLQTLADNVNVDLIEFLSLNFGTKRVEDVLAGELPEIKRTLETK